MTTLLEARGVSRTFTVSRGMFAKKRLLHAVSDVDLHIAKGEVLGLVGESGSGKSTLAKMLLGLLQPTRGSIHLGGVDVAGMSRLDMARRIQPVFQDPYSSLNPRKRVVSIVSLPLAVQGIGSTEERREKAIAMLSRVGLARRHADLYPNELSGGQRQRVAIARALVNNPSIILADEPTGNLDSQTGVEIMKLFDKLHSEGNTIILVPHERDIADYAHRTISIRDGKIAADEYTKGERTKEPSPAGL